MYEGKYHLSLDGDGLWHVSHVNLEITDLFNLQASIKTLILHKIKIYPSIVRNKSSPDPSSPTGSSLKIDWIRLARLPFVKKITGCSVNQHSLDYRFTTNITYENMVAFPYARTFNCNRNGGENITIEGLHLSMGLRNHIPAHVLIDGLPCTNVRHDPKNYEGKLSCITPKHSARTEYRSDSRVEVLNGKLPVLRGTSFLFRYANPPPSPIDIQLSNFAARYFMFTFKYLYIFSTA